MQRVVRDGGGDIVGENPAIRQSGGLAELLAGFRRCFEGEIARDELLQAVTEVIRNGLGLYGSDQQGTGGEC